MRVALNFILALAVALLVAPPLRAATCSVTNLPTTGTLTGARLNSRFDQVEACINGNIGNANITTSDKIAIGKIANDESYTAVSASVVCASTTADAFTTQLPASGTLIAAYVTCRDCSGADIDVVVEVNGSDSATFTAIANETTVSSTGLSVAVGTSQDVDVDVTVNTAGSCAALDVTMWFKIQHVQ